MSREEASRRKSASREERVEKREKRSAGRERVGVEKKCRREERVEKEDM